MVVARAHHGHLSIVDRLRENVRLASGLGQDGCLDSASQERALACLRRFGQRLRDMQAHQVRVVGTNTLRRARNADTFLTMAGEALGHPVEVISGIEEARLIYVGVSHHTDSADGANLVVDIGGGSTELIIGEGYEPKYLESLSIGCIGVSQQHFGDGRLSQKRFDRARLAARLELRPVAAAFRSRGWSRAIGSSGTVRAARDVAHELGLVDSGVSLAALETIIGKMVEARDIEDLQLPGLSPERMPVFAGGIAIFAEIMSTLRIQHMQISGGALREGLLYDMLGRLHDEDARERSIRDMQRRYHVDTEQAQRVETTAAALLGQVARAWQLTEDRYRQLLVWAARLHEVGLDIAHSRYHHHGGYLLANADLPGFVRLEQRLLAALVTFHRRKLEDPFLDDLPVAWRQPLFKLIVLLRLATLLNRSRSPSDLPPIALTAGKNLLALRFPPSWLDSNPLTTADIEQEQQWLHARGFELRLTDPLG
ncbi:MAG TPA: guanosine-5'-triphosphate,3'-diphosphate pyrophosphatase, partial [Vicinamibacterales bacterium]|nr:guanosine-5'-triphosphate,3'-diphosphate pyrophosphatase [Vicinamibacterales bacterium]